MPFELKLVQGDLVVDPFDIQLNTPGPEAIAQRIAITLRTFRGEYFLDTNFGTPWYQVVLRRGVDLRLIDSELKKVIIGVDGVLQLVSYSSVMDNGARTLRVEFVARVEDGSIQFIFTPDSVEFRVTEGDDLRITEDGNFRIL